MAASKFDDLKPRLIGAGALAILAAAFLYWGGFAFAGFVAAGVFLMVTELLTIMKRDWATSTIVGYVIAAAGAFAILVAGFGLLYSILSLVVGVVLSGVMAKKMPPIVAILGLVLIVGAGVSVVLLRFEAGGLWLVLWLILCVVAADVGGYVFGKLFQGPKFWPAVSPKKTWSGVLGGMFLTIVVAVIYCLFSGGNLGVFVVLAILISLVSVAGDLLESAVKRRYGVKDAGSILPGHGGLLDRFDGMTAVMILFFVLSSAMDVQGVLGVDYTPEITSNTGI